MTKLSTAFIHRVCVASLILCFATQLVVASDELSPDVLEYYLKKARNAVKTRNPANAGTIYSYMATSLYKYTNSHGVVGQVDTISIKYFYSWGKLDSTEIVEGDPEIFEDLVPEYEDILDQDYLFNAFPNDTGGIDLAIGFDTPNDSLPYPVGLLIINRINFTPRWLYLSYPEKQGYTKFSKAWRFTEREGLVFPDSVWIVASKGGVLGADHFRIETGVTDLIIINAAD